MLSRFVSDLRHGFRQLSLNPGFAALAIATLALGVGANTAIFSVVHAILIEPLPFHEPDRLARVWMDNRRLQMREDWASYLNYQDYKRLGTCFSQIPPAEQIEATSDIVSPSFFRTLNVKLKYGRFFDDRDHASAPHVAIVNSTFAERYWPGRDPVGKRFVFGTAGERNPWMTIAGVVEDMHRRGLHRPARLETFAPLAQRPTRGMELLVATDGSALALARAVRAEIRALDPTAPVTKVGTVEAELGVTLANRRFQALLLATFAGLALLLAAVGIFGVMYETVGRRTHEIGIRMALGAQRSDVVSLIVKRGLLLTITGVGVGVLGSIAISRVIRGLLFGIGPSDPMSLLAAVVLLGAVAIAACYLPARRATRVDPLAALRHE